MMYLRLFIFGFILSLLSCDKIEVSSDAPLKPASIPSESIWVGVLDGGVFIYLENIDPSNQNEYRGEVYYVSGDLAFKGLLYLYPENSGGFDKNNPDSYQGWDGDTIYLSHGKSLQVLE